MASRKAFASKPKPNFIYPAPAPAMISDSDSLFEFDESEIWSEGSPAAAGGVEPRKRIPATARKSAAAARPKARASAASSLPVNVPDWSKILKEEAEEPPRRWTSGGDSDEDLEFGGGGDRIPPHEYLARSRGVSFSVHEGVGRTLKGRDLRRVRNAIWKQVGFED